MKILHLHSSSVAPLVLMLAGFFASPCQVSAQYSANAEFTRFYGFVAPTGATGQNSSFYAVGGGIEQLINKGLGAGLDLNALIPGSGNTNKTIGVASFNAYFHPILTPKFDLYGTGGYSFIFRDFVSNSYNVGGGLDYWFHENRAFMFEFRYEPAKHLPELPNTHYYEVRIGLAFR